MKDETYLVGLKLSGKRCLVVGSEEEAASRADVLTAAGGEVVRVVARDFRDEDLDGIFLAVLVERDDDLAARIRSAADERNALFCAVDQPAYGNFSHVAVARVGSISLGISTDGRAPALARRLREELERILSEAQVQTLVDRLAELRSDTPSAQRRDVLSRAVENVHFTGTLQWSIDDD